MRNFGSRLAHVRVEAGMSLGDLAKRLGMSQEHLAMLEMGVERPPACEVMDIAAALGIEADRLFEGEVERQASLKG